MNILFLSQRVPYPPKKGDKLRAFHELRFLSQRHRISLGCLTDNRDDIQYVDELKKYCHSVDIVYLPSYRSKLQMLSGLFSSRPLTLSNFFSNTLQAIITRKLQEDIYDLLFVYCSSMAQYVEQIQNIPRVIDFVDVDSEKWIQYAQCAKFPFTWLYRLESQRLRPYEAFLAETFQHGFLVSEKEVLDFRNLVDADAAVSAISNGVDYHEFSPSSEPYDPNTLVFTGAMDYFANVETMLYFSREILPHIQKSIPDVKLYIVGRDPTPELLKLEEEQANIVVTGYVDQIQPYVLKSAAVVAPMRIARGIQNKILEAMAMGVPVVTNSLGFEGISATPGQDIFIEDQPEQFANQVIQLMQDSELRNSIARNARKTIEEKYIWDKNLEKLESILIETMKHNA